MLFDVNQATDPNIRHVIGRDGYLDQSHDWYMGQSLWEHCAASYFQFYFRDSSDGDDCLHINKRYAIQRTLTREMNELMNISLRVAFFT